MLRRQRFRVGNWWLVLGAALFCASAPPADAQSIDLRGVVVAVQDIAVPSQVPGRIVAFDVREGDNVNEGDLLAQLAETDALLGFKVARFTHAAAEKEAKSDIRVRAARAQADVRQAELDRAAKTRELASNAVTDMELKRLELEAKTAKLQTEQAIFQHEVSGLTERVEYGNLEVAVHEINKRRITAPFSGRVVKYGVQQGEWVSPGDPVLRLMRLDRLYVTCRVPAETIPQYDVIDRPVDVVITLGSDRQERFRSTVTYFEPETDLNGHYEVRFEIENRKVGTQWLIYPGLYTEVTIHSR